jgi:hypothetical protein
MMKLRFIEPVIAATNPAAAFQCYATIANPTLPRHDASRPGPEIPFAVRTNTMKGFLRTVFAKGTFVGANHGFV